MPRLRLDLGELTIAFESASSSLSFFLNLLNLETGEVILLNDDTRSELNAIYDVMPADLDDDDEAHRAAFARALEEVDPPEWMRETLIEADAIERDYGTQYLAVPEDDSHEAYRDMQDFIQTVPNEHLQERLWDAIRGRGAFRRFRDVISTSRADAERWQAYKDARLRERVLEWLAEAGVELEDSAN